MCVEEGDGMHLEFINEFAIVELRPGYAAHAHIPGDLGGSPSFKFVMVAMEPLGRSAEDNYMIVTGANH